METPSSLPQPDDIRAPESLRSVVEVKKHSPVVRRLIGAIPEWISPNAVTIFRCLLIVPIVMEFAAAWYLWAFATISFGMLLDFVDGALAEVRNQHTALGAFLDPLADKILVYGSLLALSLGRQLSVFALVLVVLNVVIAAGLTVIRTRKMAKTGPQIAGSAIAANIWGKLKLIAEATALLAIVLGLALTFAPLIWLGTAALVPALMLATLSFRQQLRAA